MRKSIEFIEEGEEVEIDFSGARKARGKRQAQQISIRISPSVLNGVKNRARKLGVPYQTLMQIWLAERLEVEEDRARALTDTEQKKETA